MRTLGVFVSCLMVGAVFLGIAGSVAGQGTCGLTLSASDDNPSPESFEPDETRTFTFVVENPNSLDAQGTFRVLQSPPPGWDWSTQDRTVEVPAGESSELSLRVLFLGDQAIDATLETRVEQIQCSVGGIGSPQSGGQTETVSYGLTHAPLPADAGADDGLPWAWIVFGGIVAVAAVGIPVVYRRQRVAVDAECEEPEGEVVAGRGTSYPVRLENRSSEAVHVDLEVADVQEGWSALTTLPELELASKEERTVYMMVRAPAEAKKGDLCVAKLAVTPEGGSTQIIKTLTRVATGPGAEETEPEPEASEAEDED